MVEFTSIQVDAHVDDVLNSHGQAPIGIADHPTVQTAAQIGQDRIPFETGVPKHIVRRCTT